MIGSLPSISSLKSQARQLRKALGARGDAVSHSQALELIARQHGFRDWNTLYAAVGNRPPVLKLKPGDRVKGTYLGQAFCADVIGVQLQASGERMRVTLRFDEPVDIVRFDSFSFFRSRISCTLSSDGCTSERTSDGVPHMRLEFE